MISEKFINVLVCFKRSKIKSRGLFCAGFLSDWVQRRITVRWCTFELSCVLADTVPSVKVSHPRQVQHKLPGGQRPHGLSQRCPRLRLPAPCPRVTEPPAEPWPGTPSRRAPSRGSGLQPSWPVLPRQGVCQEPAGVHRAHASCGSTTFTDSPSCPEARGAPRSGCGAPCGTATRTHPSATGLFLHSRWSSTQPCQLPPA